MISFNEPPYSGSEKEYVLKAMMNHKISGGGEFTIKCQTWFEKHLDCKSALLTPSCTHSLEMSAILLNIKDGDEVIMPSFTFVSTANAFVLRGAKVVFVDIRPDTMNIDENKIEEAITDRTKIIVPVHYAGVACEMDKILDIAKKYNIYVVEDAAQGMMSYYKELPLGSIGDIGTYSFHETKNYTSAGEGGLLIVNNKKFVTESEIVREKGTNRNQFFRGEVDKYTWVSIGSSFLMNDISAAYLWGQIENVNLINNNRLKSWQCYYDGLKDLEEKGYIQLPFIPANCQHNAHMFYIKVKDIDERSKLLQYLKNNNILAVFHYIPLHNSPAGKKYGRFNGKDIFTTVESERLIRLPLYYNIKEKEINYIIKKIKDFFI